MHGSGRRATGWPVTSPELGDDHVVAICTALADHHVSYVVIGGVAARLHDTGHATVDMTTSMPTRSPRTRSRDRVVFPRRRAGSHGPCPSARSATAAKLGVRSRSCCDTIMVGSISSCWLMFDPEENIVGIDMVGHQERHTVSRLVGAPPGTSTTKRADSAPGRVRRAPYSVVGTELEDALAGASTS